MPIIKHEDCECTYAWRTVLLCLPFVYVFSYQGERAKKLSVRLFVVAPVFVAPRVRMLRANWFCETAINHAHADTEPLRRMQIDEDSSSGQAKRL
jgi:hypothetical protein